MRITVEYDCTSNAVYIKLKEGKIASSDEVAPGIIVDYDVEGEVVGIEILRLPKRNNYLQNCSGK